MKLKTVPFAVTLLLFVHLSSRSEPFPMPQARSAPIAGVVIRSCSLNKDGMFVKNVSHRYVVYVSIRTGENGGRGSYYAYPPSDQLDFSERSQELSMRFTHPSQGGDVFAPDTTKELTYGSDPSECAASVMDTVVYADDTAEVVNEDAFRQYIQPIEEEVLTLKKENEILAQFAGSPNRIADTVAELFRVASELPDPQMRHDSEPHVNSNELVAFARLLKQGPYNYQTGKNEPVDLEILIKENSERIETETKHLHIKRLGRSMGVGP